MLLEVRQCRISPESFRHLARQRCLDELNAAFCNLCGYDAVSEQLRDAAGNPRAHRGAGGSEKVELDIGQQSCCEENALTVVTVWG